MKRITFLMTALILPLLSSCGGDGVTNDKNKDTNIYILGDSTVHNAWVSNDGRKLAGWGEFLGSYMKHPDNVVNRARSGSHSVSYRKPPTGHNKELFGVDRHWKDTERRIRNRSNQEGGFLLIQFGANEQFDKKMTPNKFQVELKKYIIEARQLKLTPVLISPPNHRNHHPSRRYAKYIKPVAEKNNTLFLDLHKKSMAVWNTYALGPAPNPQETLPEADRIFGYVSYSGNINNSHLSPKGAKIVAGWIKELACQSNTTDGISLCSQF